MALLLRVQLLLASWPTGFSLLFDRFNGSVLLGYSLMTWLWIDFLARFLRLCSDFNETAFEILHPLFLRKRFPVEGQRQWQVRHFGGFVFLRLKLFFLDFLWYHVVDVMRL